LTYVNREELGGKFYSVLRSISGIPLRCAQVNDVADEHGRSAFDLIYIADGYFHVAVTVTNLLQNGERRASIQEASGLTFVNKQAGTQRMLSVRGVLHVSAGSS
jgi:hypothetical protein